MSSDDYLFVYGTLRREAVRSVAGEVAYQQLMTDAVLVGSAEMRGLLYEVECYPAGIHLPESGSFVVGELYQVNHVAELFTVLDSYEACRDAVEEGYEFRRQRIPLKTSAGDEVLAWAYLYNCPVASLQLIESGDYLQFINAEEHQYFTMKPIGGGDFANSWFGKLLFWFVMFSIVAAAGLWFIGHADLLLYSASFESEGLLLHSSCILDVILLGAAYLCVRII